MFEGETAGSLFHFKKAKVGKSSRLLDEGNFGRLKGKEGFSPDAITSGSPRKW
jgi:hypothetical protein